MLFCCGFSVGRAWASPHSLSHSLDGAKSQVVLGVKKLFLAATVTSKSPIRAPTKEGNSGPKTNAMIK
ncbi:MAG: hypothetical protein DDT35_00998 [Firmicutes bacterium]|nr:hypothetical protein [Bacillota bacterium]